MSTLLGDYHFTHKNLDAFDSCIELLEHQALNKTDQLNFLFRSFVEKIQSFEEPVFLLPALLQAFFTINQKKPNESLTFSFFEFWLNHFSKLDQQQQLDLRSKIVGKNLPREAYQLFFPIGMDKFYPGTHFVSAHLSPDLDTTVASFISWLDAFGAKVSLGTHIWSLPGGPSEPSMHPLFEKLWGKASFQTIARIAPTLTLSAMDLMTREGMYEVKGSMSMLKIDQGLHENAILLVDDKGHFLGDWHSRDAEIVRPIIFLFKALLRRFESLFYIRILRFFADPEADLTKWLKLYEQTFQLVLSDSDTYPDLMEEEKENLNIFLKDVLGVTKGSEATFEELKLEALDQFRLFLQNLDKDKLFDNEGHLKEDRQIIFQTIENLISKLNEALQEIDQFVEQLSTSLKLKTRLDKHPPLALSLSSTIEEIRTKMESQDYLPVLIDHFPVGIIPRNALSKYPLGTVSLRDFSNFEEVNMASYLNVISVIDHHKTALQTSAPPLIVIGDVQSCNTLIAELLFQINEKYQHFVHKDRMIAEYFACLYAIIDDTDFLSKVSARDIDCVAKLLNALKNLTQENARSCIDLDEIPRDKNFCKAGSSQILKNADMFSLYDKIINQREERAKEALQHLSTFGLESLLNDTKEQNACARIGQTKLFPSNFPLFEEKKGFFQKEWTEKANKVFQAQGNIALHLHMISTIPSSKDLFSGSLQHDTHLDELWVWIPKNSGHAETLLATFLNALLDSPGIKDKAVKLDLTNDENGTLKRTFQQNFLPLPITNRDRKEEESFAVLYVKAGTLNSRKSMVSPYLPRRVS